MSYEEFKKELQEELNSRNIPNVKIIINIADNTSPQLMIANNNDIPVGQIKCPDLYYEMYKHGVISIKNVSDIIEMQIINHDFVSRIPLMNNWDIAQRYVLPQIMNTEKNTEYLKQVPHREVLDMSVVYYIEMNSANEDIRGRFVVPDFIFKHWDITEDELYRQAMNNMDRLKEPLLQDIFSVVKELSGDVEIEKIGSKYPDNYSEFYILTNKCKDNGAVYMLVPEVLGAVSCILGDDLIICPSSTHEILIWRKNESMSPEELAEIVKEVNDSVVRDNEILSYSVYEFSDNQLKIAA